MTEPDPKTAMPLPSDEVARASPSQLPLALIASFTSIVVAVISGMAAWHANSASNSVERRLATIQFEAGTVDSGANMKYDPIPAGSPWGLPANWRMWRRHVSFETAENGTPRQGYQPFSRVPQVFVSLKSLDASRSAGSTLGDGTRITIAAPAYEVNREGFELYIYTWEDAAGKSYAPSWVEVSWFAYAAPAHAE